MSDVSITGPVPGAGDLSSDGESVPRALVYGGGRQLGAHLLGHLKRAGYLVDALDLKPVGTSTPTNRIGTTVVRLIDTDDSDSALAELRGMDVSGYDVVFLCGIETFPAEDTHATEADLFDLEVQIVRSVLGGSPRRVVLTSSASVYGPGTGPLIEEDDPLGPSSRAGLHSAELERLVREAASEHGTAYAILRCGAIVGDVVPFGKPVRRLKRGLLLSGMSAKIDYPLVHLRPEPVGELPERHRVTDVVAVTDAARAHLDAYERLRGGVSHLTLNIGSGAPLTHEDLMGAADELDNVVVENGLPDAQTARNAGLSVSRARREIGWAPDMEARRSAIIGELHAIARSARAGRRSTRPLDFTHELLGTVLTRRALFVVGSIVAPDGERGIAGGRLRFEVAGRLYPLSGVSRASVRHPLRDARTHLYTLRIPLSDLQQFPVNSLVRLVHVGKGGRWSRAPLPYSSRATSATHRRGRIHRMPGGDLIAYVRQDLSGLYLTVRPRARTDSALMAPRILAARIAARLRPARSVLLFEKDSSRYEESASVLFEELVRRGRSDVRFVTDPSRLDNVPAECMPYIIRRLSLRHFYHFFSARTLLGTERLINAVELRSANRSLLRHLDSDRFRYAFLQHGVMYMVSLNALQRRWFRQEGMPGSKGIPPGSKVVCSSGVEARHFVEYGSFDPDDLYVTGLPKFDRAERDEGADRILIMPTWRPWEYNLIRTTPDEAPYVLMLRSLLEAVPEGLRSRTHILPHPLVLDALKESELDRYVWPGTSYDAALQQCSLLITDYSSIAYDAFYRGSNVVFWWKEKEACMRRYRAELMLDERSAFGPVCRTTGDLRSSIGRLVDAPQDEEHVRRFRRLVEFHDGRNTERLIATLERDGLI